jgi:hypothetical protein
MKEVDVPQEGYGKLIKNPGTPNSRIMVGIPMTGLLRSEWVLARYGQVIPCNWAQADMIQFVDQWSPLNHTVADARNIIATAAVEKEFEWVFFIDHDTILPQGTILKLNERMIEGKVPVWSGLYFTKSVPAEPLVYRELGRGYYPDWKLGEDVEVIAVPMGCTMINVKLLKVMYDEAETYNLNGMHVKRIFETPAKMYYDVDTLSYGTQTGTEDIDWCNKVIKNRVFEKAGFPEYQEKEYPFLVDTSIFCKHIDPTGRQYPMNGEEQRFLPDDLKITKEQFIDRLRMRFNMLYNENAE